MRKTPKSGLFQFKRLLNFSAEDIAGLSIEHLIIELLHLLELPARLPEPLARPRELPRSWEPLPDRKSVV